MLAYNFSILIEADIEMKTVLLAAKMLVILVMAFYCGMHHRPTTYFGR